MAKSKSIEIQIGQLVITVPPKTLIEERLKTPQKFYLEADFKGQIQKYHTNLKLRDHLDAKINSYTDTLYLDAAPERLKLWTSSFLCILRVATYLNGLLGTPVSVKEIEDIRKAYVHFSPSAKKNSDGKEYERRISGLLDFYYFKCDNGQFTELLVKEDLRQLFSDCRDHEDIEDEAGYALVHTPNEEDIEFDSNEDCFVAYAVSKEGLVDLLSVLNRMLDISYTENDKEELLTWFITRG